MTRQLKYLHIFGYNEGYIYHAGVTVRVHVKGQRHGPSASPAPAVNASVPLLPRF